MAEVIGYNIVANLLIKMGAVPFREICLVYGVGDELGKLKETLNTIEAALLDADQRKEKGHLMQDWISKLNDAVYDADDVLDAFATKALQRELNTDGRINMKVREFFSSSNQLAFRYKLGHKIMEMIERFDEIAANMSKVNTERLIVQASVENSDRETISFVSTSYIIGREKDKEEIIKLIMSTRNNEENVTVITIVGMGGLGKTTLTQLVYNDKKVVEYFELRLWVCVSVDFEKKSLVKKILKSLTNNEVGDLDLEQLQIHLRENLDGKRFLLVLDDIWNEIPQKWELVKKLLMCGAKGSKIVVTTRSRTVASVMGTENPYILKGLSNKQSWTLFEKVAFGGDEIMHSKLEVIGKEIIEKCKGVPLAIRSLASVMQYKTQESEWLSIRNSDVWSLSQDDEDILPVLKLSYDYLPIHLRQCFAYCSIFPKDFEIQKEVLIQLWMAQGYIQSSNNIQCLEDIGGQYFRNLLSRSFFQDAKVNDYNEVITCKMHDLIHDLAIKVAGSDCHIVERDANNISEKVRHVSISSHGTKLPTQLMKAKGLRTMLGNDSPHVCKVLSKFRCLRVLDVSYCKVLKSIRKLQHLRYLDLSGNKFTSLSDSIRKLVNLQTLKLSGCGELKRLPEGITKLINLRYLVTDGCSSLEYMPSGMGKLTSLRRLNKFVVGGNKWGLQLRELNELNELRGNISIKGLENVRNVESESKEANLKAKQYLHSLTLKWKVGEDSSKFDDEEILLKGLQPHSELKELTIKGYSGQMLPSWMTFISLPNIVSITLKGCDRCRQLPPFDELPFLKVLHLSSMLTVEYIDDNNLNLATKSLSSSSLFFPSLEELCIHDLPNLKGWCSGSSSSREGASESSSDSELLLSFPRLTILKITECPTLTSMPMIPHVEELDLSRVCEKLLRQLLTTTTEGFASSSSSSIPSSSSPLSSKLKLIVISDLESLTEEVLRSIYDSHKVLTTTTTSARRGVAVYLPSSPFSSKLRSLHISEIDELEFLPVEVFRNVPSLEHLEIYSCPRLSSFAVSEEEGFRALPSLRSLFIYDCDSLTSFVSGLTQHLTALQFLAIRSCHNFDLSGDHGVHWQCLKSLRKLQFLDIPKLVSLPVGLQQVTTLHHLQILLCPGMMALPDWISNLTSLQRLIIYMCPLLSKRCQKETDEDWSKISHIPNIIIEGKVIQGTLFPLEFSISSENSSSHARTITKWHMQLTAIGKKL